MVLVAFAELLACLSHDRHLKGRQFERVCRWYLEHDPVFKHQLRKVWLWKDWPDRWGPDAGIDLVAETHSGELWAVQAKAYAPSASVTKADIDTFLSESSRPQFAMRLLVATTDHISPNAHRTILAQEKPVRVVTASELGKAALAWPSHPDELKAPPLPKKSPRPHQTRAIEDVLRGFETQERGQLIMACGTGKTMVSLWVWEALDAPTALVVLPSLSLLAQTVREWCANARTAFDFLAVCSDESVTDSDLIVRSASELPFATTTDATKIAAFLEERGDGRRILFSTYQSTPRIAEALAIAGTTIDLVVADEAHRCAGRVDGGFSTILKDEQIPSRRRLFMTATPRYLSGRVVKAAEDLDVEVVSMDDEAVFGPVFHALTFGEAISQGLLTDYQVAIIGVEGRRYQEMAEQATLVQHGEGKITDARTLAAQAALLKGMAKYDLKRCVTFHSRVARARRFADSLDEVTGSLPPTQRPTGRLWADHVSGAMRSASRESRLDRLRSLDGCDRGLLANARCLAEGVDVPSLDAIAFVDPRGSQVDIVQAVGRVIRKAEDKRLGTVLLPVFVGGDCDSVEAVGASVFDPVWRVLNALRAHDDVLADQLDALRTRLGRFGKPGHPSKIVLDLPVGVSDDFVRAFDVRLLEKTTQSWPARYGLLQAFCEREGHARVPVRHMESGYPLGEWTASQRASFARGELSPDRAAWLEALPGWAWSHFQDSWERGMEALRHYVEREGHARVPRQCDEAGFALGLWVATQRRGLILGRLGPERAALLDAVPGWTWDLHQEKWERGMEALRHYVEREGHARVPLRHYESGMALGRWVANQREVYSSGRLDVARADLLEALPGWTWHALQDRWERALDALQHFVEREGHARPALRQSEDGFALGEWVAHQRAKFASKKLDYGKAALLDALPGWTWDPLEDRWQRGFEALRGFADREGHAKVPACHKESGVALGSWAARQRQQFAEGKLDREKAALLDSLPGWEWDPLGDTWQRGFDALRQYVEREGHMRLPASHAEAGVPLQEWVMYQRTRFAHGKLDGSRAALLEAVPGWTWEASQMIWERGIQALECFVEREGHARVPGRHVEKTLALGAWVQRQRRFHAAHQLTQERIAALESYPGWVWDVIGTGWDRSYAALRQFAEREGHALVPQAHEESGLRLGAWVAVQRMSRAKGTLSAERVARLEAIPGWQWSVRPLRVDKPS